MAGTVHSIAAYPYNANNQAFPRSCCFMTTQYGRFIALQVVAFFAGIILLESFKA